MADRFDKFSPGARKVLTYAQEESQRFNHNYLGPEHILLALLRDRDEIAAKVLANLNVDADKVRDAVETIAGRGNAPVSGEIGLTARAKKVIELSVEEARRLNHSTIGTEHLLVGILAEGQSAAFAILQSMGVTLERAQIEMARTYSQSLTLTSQPPLSSELETQESPGEFGANRPPGSMPILGESSEPPGSRPDPRHQSPQRFDRFTDRARRVLTLSQEEAQHHGEGYIDTEHLLLGLVSVGDGVGLNVLKSLDLQPGKIRGAVELTLGRSRNRFRGEAGLTTRAKKVIELAVGEARRLKHSYVGTEHLLAGLVLEGEGVAFVVLDSLGVTIDVVRAETLQLLAKPPQPTRSTSEAAGSEFGTSLSVTDIGALRTAPNAELRNTAIGLLREAKSVLDAIIVVGLAKALIQALPILAVTRLIDLMDLQTFNRQEYEDGNTRIKQSLDVLNATAEAIQPFDSTASMALMAASAAVQRALAR